MAMLGVLDWATRELLVHTSRTKRSSDFIDLLSELGRRYGPRPGLIGTPVVLVLDNGPIHTSKASRRLGGESALAERRVVAEICPRAERHRGCLARCKAPPPRTSDLRLRR